MLESALDYSGRIVLVTGGTKGIGFEIARTFLAAGAGVMVCARTRPTTLPAADGRSATFVAADLRDASQAAGVVESTLAEYGRLDVAINNAGGSPDADAATVSTRFIDKIVALNLLAPFYVAQAANRIMQAQDGGGCIVNIGSVSAHDPQPGTAAYSAAKAGLLMLTRALALEWAPAVRVNHVTTGLTRTEAAADGYGADGGEAIAGVIPMRRFAEPADIAGVCLFLASSLSSYVTGADLAVHGGGEVPARYAVSDQEPRGGRCGR